MSTAAPGGACGRGDGASGTSATSDATAVAPADATTALDRCPRCGGGFHCGMAGPAPCPCTTVTLPPALLATLNARYQGCLCLGCLQALAAGAPVEAIDPLAPGTPGA